ncbi:MAG: hypothetical protein OEY93_03920 [Anaerolineae bacterium]|nr:hypothetical protein [Anaerolineae bacterium]
MYRKITRFLNLLFMLTLISCSFNSPSKNDDGRIHQLSIKDRELADIVKVEEFNTKFIIYAPADELVSNSMKVGDFLVLVIENISKDKIVFGGDFGVKLYRYDTNWVPVENLISYGTRTSEITLDSTKGLNIDHLQVIPIFEFDKSIKIRIVVVGEIIGGLFSDNHRAASFVDVLIAP